MPKKTSRTRKQTPQGKTFAQLCELLRITPTYLRDALGIANLQSISHWKYRGVAREYAIPVATILKCHPTDISIIRLEQDVKHQEASNRKSKQEIAALIMERGDDLDPDVREQLYKTVASFFF